LAKVKPVAFTEGEEKDVTNTTTRGISTTAAPTSKKLKLSSSPTLDVSIGLAINDSSEVKSLF
jgi:hypothetical protein